MLDLYKTIFSYSVYRILAMALSVLYVVYLAKILSAEMLGVYYLSMTIMTFAMVLARLGFDQFVVKYFSILHSEGKFYNIQYLLDRIKKYVFISSIITTLIIILFSDLIAKYIMDSNENKFIIIIMSLIIYSYNMLFIYSEALKGFNELKLSVVFPSILFPLFNIIFISILFPFFDELSIFISVNLSVLILYVLASIIISKKLISSTDTMHLNIEYNNYLLPNGFYLISISNIIFATVDTLVLGLFASNVDVGVYNILLRILLPFSVILIVLNNIYARDFAILYKNNKIDKYRELYLKITYITWLPALLYLLFVIYFSQNILLFFGSEYLVGTNALVILSIGYFMLLITGPSATILMMTGHESIYKKILIYVGILSVALSFIFIGLYGLVGAAISTSLTLIIKNIITYVIAKKLIEIKLV